MCVGTHIYTVSNLTGINEEKKQLYLPNKEHLSNHKCIRTNLHAKCEIFVNAT